ncbi:MAG: tetratricopeptide repeat-containing serine protease family protein [Pseudomonadota bacterium]
MKKAAQGFLIMTAFLFGADVHAKTASEVFDAVSSSIVVIRTYDAEGKNRGLGSGVFLSGDVIATNCHVIEHAASAQVVYRGKTYSANLLHSDWDRDICTLTVIGIKAPAVMTGSTSRLKVGTRVYAVGAPQGLELTLSEGIISSLRPVVGGQYLQITAPISPGSSGGGLFDEEGRLIGLTSFYLAKGQQLNFAVPVEWISELPKRHQKTFKGAETTTISWITKAVAILEKKDWAGLLAHSLRWIKMKPKDADAWTFLGLAYVNSGQTAKAVDAFQQSLRINPEHAIAWNNLGTAYADSGQTAKAVDAFQQSLRINPEDAYPWNNLGVNSAKAGQTAKAIDAFQQSLRINPEDASAWNNLGAAYADSGQTAKAIDAYKQSLRINPEYATAWYNLGIVYRQSGRTDQVMEVYKRLKTIDPAFAERFFNQVVLP